MEIDTGAFRALAERVDELADEMKVLREQALVLRSLEEMFVQRAYGITPWLEEGKTPPKAAHLRPIDGGAS